MFCFFELFVVLERRQTFFFLKDVYFGLFVSASLAFSLACLSPSVFFSFCLLPGFIFFAFLFLGLAFLPSFFAFVHGMNSFKILN